MAPPPCTRLHLESHQIAVDVEEHESLVRNRGKVEAAQEEARTLREQSVALNARVRELEVAVGEKDKELLAAGVRERAALNEVANAWRQAGELRDKAVAEERKALLTINADRRTGVEEENKHLSDQLKAVYETLRALEKHHQETLLVFRKLHEEVATLKAASPDAQMKETLGRLQLEIARVQGQAQEHEASTRAQMTLELIRTFDKNLGPIIQGAAFAKMGLRALPPAGGSGSGSGTGGSNPAADQLHQQLAAWVDIAVEVFRGMPPQLQLIAAGLLWENAQGAFRLLAMETMPDGQPEPALVTQLRKAIPKDKLAKLVGLTEAVVKAAKAA